MSYNLEYRLFGVAWAVIAVMICLSLDGMDLPWPHVALICFVAVLVYVVAKRWKVKSDLIDNMNGNNSFLQEMLRYHSQGLDWEDMSETLEGLSKDFRYIIDQLLSDEQVSLKLEEMSLRRRLIDLSKVMAEGVDDEHLEKQAMAMVLYHAELLMRCVDEGIIVKD